LVTNLIEKKLLELKSLLKLHKVVLVKREKQLMKKH